MIFNPLKIKHFIFNLSLVCVILFFLLASCKKTAKPLKLSFQSIQTPVNSRISKTVWLNANTGYMCGGVKNASGFIYKTVDSGKTWEQVYQSNAYSFYDIAFINDTIAYCCGDKLFLLKSKDNGATWNEVKYNFTPEWFNYMPLRCITGDLNFLMIVGGDNYDTGNVLWFQGDEMRWVWHFDHEFRTCLNFSQNNFLLAGYGTAYRTTDQGYSYKPTNLTGDYFTSSATINSRTGYACGYNGGIFKTSDEGVTWKKIYEENKVSKKRKHFNGICFTDEKNGWVVGNEGLIMKTTDGENWIEMESIGSDDLISIVKDKTGHLIISSNTGKLFQISY